MRPPDKQLSSVPGRGPLTHDELTQGFYNLMAQFQDEQQYVQGISEVVMAHATNLEQAEELVTKLRDDKVSDKEKTYSELTVDISNLYDRISMERQEALAHQQQGMQADERRLYDEITKERITHVGEVENILKTQIDAQMETVNVRIE